MHLIQKIKSYYIRHDFYLWRDFNQGHPGLSFSEPHDDLLMDMGTFIREYLIPATELGSERHRLHPDAAFEMRSIDEVLVFFRSCIDADLGETEIESRIYNWHFHYRCDFHPKCREIITISTVLKSDDKKGYCVYQVASVRLYNNVYYCWSHLK